MIKLLQFLFSGCWHKWEDLKSVDVDVQRNKAFANGVETAETTSYTRYYGRCVRCGVHKVWNAE